MIDSVLVSKAFWAGAVERAVKTFAQVVVALIGTGVVGIVDVDWKAVAGAAALAAVVSLLTSVASGAFPTGVPSASLVADRPGDTLELGSSH